MPSLTGSKGKPKLRDPIEFKRSQDIRYGSSNRVGRNLRNLLLQTVSQNASNFMSGAPDGIDFDVKYRWSSEKHTDYLKITLTCTVKEIHASA